MPLCPRCSNPFVCKCGDQQPKKLGAEAEACPAKKPGAVWVHVVDERGVDVNGVDTKKGDDRRQTDRGGTAVFDPVPPGSYKVDLEPLSTGLLELFEAIKTPMLRTVTVVPGQIAYVPYQLARKPVLNVLVVQRKPHKVFGRATATAVGPESPSEYTREDTGVAELGRVTAGKYKITVQLATKDAETFATTLDFSKKPEEVTLAAGEEREVVVEVEAINVVTPQVEMAEKLLIIDHWPDSREAVAECVELSLKQTNMAHPYDKSIALKCASDTDVEAFLDPGCSDGKKLGGALTGGAALPQPEQDELRKGEKVKVYLRGKTQAGKLAISLELEKPANRFVKLGDKPAPVDAEIELRARPHVNIKWADGSGVDGVKVALDPSGANHAIPDSIGGGFAKWIARGIKPGLYQCALTFPGDVKYLLFDAEDKPVQNPSFEFKPGSESVTYKVKKVTVDLALTCDGVAGNVEAKVKVKAVGTAVTLKKGSAAIPVEIPVTEVNQKCEIETFTLDGTEVYEMIDVVPT